MKYGSVFFTAIPVMLKDEWVSKPGEVKVWIDLLLSIGTEAHHERLACGYVAPLVAEVYSELCTRYRLDVPNRLRPEVLLAIDPQRFVVDRDEAPKLIQSGKATVGGSGRRAGGSTKACRVHKGGGDARRGEVDEKEQRVRKERAAGLETAHSLHSSGTFTCVIVACPAGFKEA